MLDPTCTQTRQNRMRALMDAQNLDILYLSDVRDIYYGTGQLLTVPDPAAHFPALFALAADGSSWLVSHTMEGDALVTQRFAYEPALAATMNPDPMTRLNDVVAAVVETRRLPGGIAPLAAAGHHRAHPAPWGLGAHRHPPSGDAGRQGPG
jgi:hypothetical protein